MKDSTYWSNFASSDVSSMYLKERFAHLKSRNKKLSTPEEIEDELHYLELQLGSSQGVNIGASGLCMAMTCLERSTDYWNPSASDIRHGVEHATNTTRNVTYLLVAGTIIGGAIWAYRQ